MDCVGSYARTTLDIATPSAILQGHEPEKYFPLLNSWDGLKVGSVDPMQWRSYPTSIEPVEGFFEQTDAAMFAAQERIQALGGKVVKWVPLASWDDIVQAMPDFANMEDLFRT